MTMTRYPTQPSPFQLGDEKNPPPRGVFIHSSHQDDLIDPLAGSEGIGQLPDVPRHSKDSTPEESIAVLKALISRCQWKRAKWNREHPQMIPDPSHQIPTDEKGANGDMYLLQPNGERTGKIYRDRVTGLDYVYYYHRPWEGRESVTEKIRGKKAGRKGTQ